MSIKTKVGMALATTALGAALVGGGTFALFTSSATNEGNTFTAGKLVISDATGGAVFRASANLSNLAPGDSDSTKTLSIKNDGNLDAWVKIDGITTNANATFKDGIGDLFEGPTPVVVTHQTTPILIPAGQTKEFTTAWSFPSSAGNDYQEKTGTVTFNVKAVQARNNTKATNDGPTSWN